MTDNERNAHMEIWASREADEPHKCPECGSEMRQPQMTTLQSRNFDWYCFKCNRWMSSHEKKVK